MIFLRIKQRQLENFEAIAGEIRQEYEYVRQDGTIGMRLQGMRELIAAMYWLEQGTPPPGVEIGTKCNSEDGVYCTGQLALKDREEVSGMSNKVVCKMSEHRVKGDLYWEQMPIARLRQVTEARLYRSVYPLIVGGYAEVESDIQPTSQDIYEQQPPPLDVSDIDGRYCPPVTDEYLSQIGDLECLVTIYEDGGILKKTDPEIIKDAHERGVRVFEKKEETNEYRP